MQQIVLYLNKHKKSRILKKSFFAIDFLEFCGIIVTLKINMEAYRSGHNGTDSKSVVPNGTVGSNPTASAK